MRRISFGFTYQGSGLKRQWTDQGTRGARENQAQVGPFVDIDVERSGISKE